MADSERDSQLQQDYQKAKVQFIKSVLTEIENLIPNWVSRLTPIREPVAPKTIPKPNEHVMRELQAKIVEEIKGMQGIREENISKKKLTLPLAERSRILCHQIEEFVKYSSQKFQSAPEAIKEMIMRNYLKGIKDLTFINLTIQQCKPAGMFSCSEDRLKIHVKKFEDQTDFLEKTIELYTNYIKEAEFPSIVLPGILELVEEPLPVVQQPEMDLNRFKKECITSIRKLIDEKWPKQISWEREVIKEDLTIKKDTPDTKTNEDPKKDFYLEGLNYYYGNGVQQNYLKAIESLKQDEGGWRNLELDGKTSVLLGQMYLEGKGVDIDEEMAERQFNKVEKVNLDANYWLGYMYNKRYLSTAGDEGKKDSHLLKAMRYYERAAAHKHLEALCELAYIHESHGKTAEARQLLEQAAAEGHAKAMNNLGVMYLKDMIPETNLNDNDLRAFQLFKRAAQQGFVAAETNLGQMYLEGRGVPADYSVACELFRRAADKSHPEAYFFLGLLKYRNGFLQSDHQSYEEANFYFRLASAHNPNHSFCNYYLGSMDENGVLGKKDLGAARAHYEKAALDPTNDKALFKLGQFHLNGQGGYTIDKSKAISYFTKSASLGNTEAQIHLGKNAEADQNFALAYQFYTEAGRRGEAKGLYLLGELLKNPRASHLDKRAPESYQAEAERKGYKASQFVADSIIAKFR